MKKAQIEIVGLLIIVIVIIIGSLFYIKFSLLKQPTNNNQIKNIISAAIINELKTQEKTKR